MLHPVVDAVDATNTCASDYAFNPQPWESVEGFRLARIPDAAAFRIVELQMLVMVLEAGGEAVGRSGEGGIEVVPTDELRL